MVFLLDPMAASARKGFATSAPSGAEPALAVEDALGGEPVAPAVEAGAEEEQPAAVEDTPEEPAPVKLSVKLRMEAHTEIAAAIGRAWGADLEVLDLTADGFWLKPAGRDLERFARWLRQRWAGGFGVSRSRGAVQLVVHPEGGYVPGAGVTPSVEW